MNERTLLRRLKEGDTGALSEIIALYTPYLYAIASNILSHALGEEDIEEVVSDSFLSLWENREHIETEMLKAYLAAITRNKAKSALRKARAEEPLEDDLIQISIPNQPERRILLSELRDITRAAVDSLGEPDREIFQRYYFLYQKTGDIARALGLKDATVRVKLARGRKRLKDYLEERGFGCEDTHF